jgi:MFS family permease
MLTDDIEPRAVGGLSIRIWSPPYRRLTIGLLLIITVTAYEALAVATVMPATAADLGGLALYGWAFSAFMLANLFGASLAGPAIDRAGATLPFATGGVLFLAGLLLAGFAPSMPVLIAARAVQGLGAGFISSISYAVIGRGYPTDLRPQMLALTATAWVVPGLIGPALAGLIASVSSWRWVFLSVVPLPLIALICALPALRMIGPTSASEPAGRRILFAGLLVVGASLFTVGLGAGSLLPGAALVGAGLACAIPALHRLLPAGALWAAPGLPAAIALMGLLNLVFFGIDAFVPLALTTVRGQHPSITGLALTAATITWTTGSWLQAAWVRRVGRAQFVGVGLVLVAVGIAGVGAVVRPDTPVLLGPLSWAVAGLGIGLAYATLSLVVLDEAPEGQQGASTAAMQLAAMLGTALGTGVGGVVVVEVAATPAVGIQIHAAAMIALALLGAALAPRLGRGRRAG